MNFNDPFLYQSIKTDRQTLSMIVDFQLIHRNWESYPYHFQHQVDQVDALELQQ